MSKSKKQHFIPQFILQNFSIENSKQLWVFDKTQEKQFKAAIRDTASERYYYEISEDEENINTEQKLSELESKCSNIFKKIISEKSIKDINQIEHSLLCLFCAVQFLRINKTREFLEHFNAAFVDKLKERNQLVTDYENIINLSKDEIKDISIIELNSSAGEIAKHFMDKEVAIVESPVNENFYISDNPITLYNHFPRPNRGNLGLKLKGIEIHFPISSKLCLLFLCSETINEIRDAVKRVEYYKNNNVPCPVDMSESEEYVQNIEAKKCIKLSSENVEFHNSLQVAYSSRYIYSCKDNFELAKDMIKDEPELKVPKRVELL